jgi:hypothetical protein
LFAKRVPKPKRRPAEDEAGAAGGDGGGDDGEYVAASVLRSTPC